MAPTFIATVLQASQAPTRVDFAAIHSDYNFDASPQHPCADAAPVAPDRDRAAVGGHVSRVAARYRAKSCDDRREGAAHAVVLSCRLCDRSGVLWSDFGSARAAAGTA